MDRITRERAGNAPTPRARRSLPALPGGRGSAALAAVGLGDKRNLSFRAVRFQKTFSWSKLDGRFFAPFWPIHIIADPAILLNFTRAY